MSAAVVAVCNHWNGHLPFAVGTFEFLIADIWRSIFWPSAGSIQCMEETFSAGRWSVVLESRCREAVIPIVDSWKVSTVVGVILLLLLWSLSSSSSASMTFTEPKLQTTIDWNFGLSLWLNLFLLSAAVSDVNRDLLLNVHQSLLLTVACAYINIINRFILLYGKSSEILGNYRLWM